MAGTRPCSKCAKRRKAAQAREQLLKSRAKGKRAKGQRVAAKIDDVQAAALGAVLAVSEAVGQTLGIHGEVEDGRFQSGNVGRTGGPSDESGEQG
jgi:hypothetical protein